MESLSAGGKQYKFALIQPKLNNLTFKMENAGIKTNQFKQKFSNSTQSRISKLNSFNPYNLKLNRYNSSSPAQNKSVEDSNYLSQKSANQ